MKNIMTKAIPFILFLGIASVPPTPDASALSISGSIDKRLIHKVIRMHENEIKYCYNVALMKNKSLNGTLRTVFVILPDGSVNRAVVLSSTLNNPEVEQCVLDHIKTWKFPECKNGSMLLVEYPYTFVSSYKPPTVLEHIRVILNEDDMKVEYLEAPPTDP